MAPHEKRLSTSLHRAENLVRSKRRIVVRTICIFQLLAILTCSFVVTTFWLMVRLESFFCNGKNHPNENLDPGRISSLLYESFVRTDAQDFQMDKPAREGLSVERDAIRMPRTDESGATAQALSFHHSSSMGQIPQSLEYLGVLIDGGRHYFPMQWLYETLEHLHTMGYNYIQFRLTDDQNFILNLTMPENSNGDHNSSPEGDTSLAFVARRDQEQVNLRRTNHSLVQHYQPQELSKFVRFAKKTYNITVVPEINIPGHAGAWGANPRYKDAVVSCPKFVCSNGYGIPLNLTNPFLPTMIRTVLTQVIEIFDRPPFLHLGGDELHMSLPCLEEAGIEDPSSWLRDGLGTFEGKILGPIVKGLGYDPHQIIRWERTGGQDVQRLGGITHYWESSTPSTEDRPYMISTGLYLDVQGTGRLYGYGDFQSAKEILSNAQSNPPIAIVAGTFELGTEFWEDRNVMGRLLAIRMGVPSMDSAGLQTQQSFRNEYIATCNAVFSKVPDSESMCSKVGWPRLEDRRYRAKWKKVWTEWKDGLCNALTRPVQTPHIDPLLVDDGLQREANYLYWERILSANENMKRDDDSIADLGSTSRHRHNEIPMVGIVVDLTQASVSHRDYDSLLRVMKQIGMNTIQLRLASEFGQVLEYDTLPDTTYRATLPNKSTLWNGDISFDGFFNLRQLKQFVEIGRELGIRSVPEIDLATNGAGWFKTGMLMDCPQVLCDNGGRGVALDVVEKLESALPIVLAIIQELKGVFSSTSPEENPFLLHMGGDERILAAKGCFAEANHSESEAHSALERFERKLSAALSLLGVDQKNIVRWHNEEKHQYQVRTGTISHYLNVRDVIEKPGENSIPDVFFGTVLITSEMTPKEVYQETRRWTTMKPSSPFALVAKGADGQIPNIDQLIAFAVGLQHHDGSEDSNAFELESKSIRETLRVPETVTEIFGSSHLEIVTNRSCTDRTSYTVTRG